MVIRLPRVNLHVLTVFLIVGLPLFAIAAFMVVGTGQAQLRQSQGQQLAQIAEHAAAGLDAYIYRRIIDASLIARVSDVRAAVAAGNAVPFDRAAATRLTPGWLSQPKRGAPALTGRPGVNPAAKFFSEVAAADALFREIVATDASGRVVATRTPLARYFVGDESWWQEARGDGQQGRATVSDILWDARSRAHVLEIAVPITDESGAGVAGVLRVVSDGRELLALVADLQLGASGNAFLLREDGTVLFSRWPAPSSGPFYAGDLIRERLQGLRDTGQPGRFYLSARDEQGAAQVIGLARSQLGLTYPHLSWLVGVSAADAELMAPVHSTGRNLLLVLALIAVAVLGFTLWDSRRLAASPEVMETDLHLVDHPKVHWIEEAEEEPDEMKRPAPAGV